ncbi:hypothetical protein F4823DRAFT_630706 [Ustulina deusta]|nr:hypothetical protein F4823DRAFT_630706 [Ustulina deusta]
MNYKSISHLNADSVTSHHAGNIFHVYGNGTTRNSRFFNFPNTGQYPHVSIDYSIRAPSDDENITTAQSNLIDNTISIRPGGNTISPNVPTLPSFTSFPLPMSQSQLPHLSSYVRNMTRMPHNTFVHFGEPNTTIPIRTPVEAATHAQVSTLITGVSPNYQGDPYLRANQPANIPDELNTSVWITNLPPNLNHKMLLGSVRNCGKVYASVVNGPEHGHITAASKLVFFDVAGAQNLLRQYHIGKFIVDGYMPRVRYNRIKTEARSPSPASRVLHIEGPSCIVNQSCLAYLFRADGIVWQDEVVIVLSSNEVLTRLEWRFGSYRCQAESARLLIDRVKRQQHPASWEHQLWQRVTVHFGVDPCAPKPVVQQMSTFQGTKAQYF